MLHLERVKEKGKICSKKFIFLICCLFTISTSSYAQTAYYIVNIKGKIVSQKTGKQLQRGDKINGDESIKFGSSEAVAITIGTNKGRFILKSTKEPEGSNSELYHMVKTVLLPMSTVSPLNSRGSDLVREDDKLSLQDFLGKGSFVFLEMETRLPFDTNEYALPNKRRIIWQSMAKSGKGAHSVLELRDKEIIVNKDKVGVITDSAMVRIYAEDLLSSRKTTLAEFVPVFVDKDDLKEELLIQKRVLENAGLSQMKTKQELENYVSQVYGKMEYATFQSLFDQLQN